MAQTRGRWRMVHSAGPSAHARSGQRTARGTQRQHSCEEELTVCSCSSSYLAGTGISASRACGRPFVVRAASPCRLPSEVGCRVRPPSRRTPAVRGGQSWQQSNPSLPRLTTREQLSPPHLASPVTKPSGAGLTLVISRLRAIYARVGELSAVLSSLNGFCEELCLLGTPATWHWK